MSSSSNSNEFPQRYIFNASDMQEFRESSCRRDLLAYVRALGSAASAGNPNNNNDCGNILSASTNLALGCLWGSLCAMEQLVQDIPADPSARARFGNPAFKTWHSCLQKRSTAIVSQILDSIENPDSNITLEEAKALGFEAASKDATHSDETNQVIISPHVMELQAYLLDSFGHPIRIDYGTGHESSFLVFLYSLSKLASLTSKEDLQAVALGIFSQYLAVARSVQTTYMLEPAGTHGVWGLDDYYCLAFYLGACQLSKQTTIVPQSIHDAHILDEYSDKFMYLKCIQFIKQIKTNVPFFESSPMLNDISHLASWEKISTGLLRLYEGEVLDKLQVVQHFKFGSIFQATWTPSQQHPAVPPTATPFSLRNTTDPADNTITTTRAPWAT